MNSVFKIRHKATGEWWMSRKGKTFWRHPGHAKNAWNIGQRYGQPKFDEDGQYEIVEFVMVQKDEYERLMESVWRRTQLEK